MRFRQPPILRNAWFTVGVLASFSELAMAYVFARDVSLEAFLDANRHPRIHSYAVAELLDNQFRRIYDAEVILGHNVFDKTIWSSRFDARIVTYNGYASSTTRDLITREDLMGDYQHCYDAAMIAHANAYSLHQDWLAPEDCIPPGPHDPPPIDPGTPILLDLEMDGFHLTGPNPPVAFDVDADGVLDQVAWTRAGEDEAFLCLDRNDNGTIDDGRELFGDVTLLISGGTAESGYYALAEMDEPTTGGNDDGKVDAADPLFNRLCAWLDGNRDGVSQPKEIHTLDEVGVVAFERRFKKMHREDDFGNLFRYTSRAYMQSTSDGVTSWPTYDVIFAVP